MDSIITDERDKSEWVRCKDWVKNYSYISISTHSLSKILKVSEEVVNKALNKEISSIDNRFTICRFNEEIPELL